MTRNPLNFSTDVLVADIAADAETVVAILNGVTCQFAGDTFKIAGFVNTPLDADCTSVVLAVRRGSLAGDQVGNGAQVNVVAGDQEDGFDISIAVNDTPGDVANLTYVLTVLCNDSSAPAHPNLVSLSARCD